NQNAKVARQVLVGSRVIHESDHSVAHPAGEWVVPRRARAALDLAAVVANLGVLGRDAVVNVRATVQAPAGGVGQLVAVANAAPKSVKVEQLLYEWLHEKLGLPRPAETIASVTKRLRAELDDIANLRPHRRPEAVKLFLERHVELLQGPALPAMRLTRQGLMVANKIEALLALDAAEFGSIEVPTAREAVAASFRAMRALFPWSTPEGLPTFSFSPGALAQLTRAM